MQDDIFRGGFASITLSSQRTRDATLLRASTELFVQVAENDRDAVRRYEELGLHLLPRVSPADRVHVAEKLADRADAPLAVIRLLAKDELAVAEVVLRRSPVLSGADLLAIVAATGPGHHRAISARPDLDPGVAGILRLNGARDTQPADRPTTPPKVAPAAPTAPRPRGAFEAFLALDRPGRLRRLAEIALEPSSTGAARPAGGLDRAFKAILGAAELAGLARGGERGRLLAIIASTLDLDERLVAASLDDESGEPLALLLKAMALDPTQAQQVMLLAAPKVGRDVTAFFRAADLYQSLEPWVAEAMVRAWRRPSAPPAHQPVYADRPDRLRPAAEAPERQLTEPRRTAGR